MPELGETPPAPRAPAVRLIVPRLLSDCTAGQTSLSLSAGTLEAAVAEIRRRWPTLGVLVFDESGAPRPHVLLLHNGRATRWQSGPAVALREGDALEIVQAVSGG